MVAEPPLWAVAMMPQALSTVPSKSVPMDPFAGAEPPVPVPVLVADVDVIVRVETEVVLEVIRAVVEVVAGAVPGKHWE